MRVRFTFATEASTSDPKSTVISVKRMQIEDDDDCFAFPPHLEAASAHSELFALPTIKRVKKSLDKRHMVTKVWITLTSDIAKLYLDSDTNPVFNDTILQAAPQFELTSFVTKQPVTPAEDSKPLVTILKDAVLEKFGSTPTDASSWLDQFELECSRLKVPENRYWEAICLFLTEGTAMDWFKAAKIELKSKPWDQWQVSFLDAFAQKGWASARDAIRLRYDGGSLADYALKKVNLLVSFNPKMDELTKIALIVIGLPYAVQERIDRSEIESVSKLLSKLNSFERQTRFPANTKDCHSRKPTTLRLIEKLPLKSQTLITTTIKFTMIPRN